jgi:hypothetical protein
MVAVLDAKVGAGAARPDEECEEISAKRPHLAKNYPAQILPACPKDNELPRLLQRHYPVPARTPSAPCAR